MSVLDPREVYFLYGSQTGNADEISKDLCEKCAELGIPCKRETLNAAKSLKLKDVAKCIVIVCSTTGNGDSPENADGFWRSVKLRSAAKDLLAGIKYAVLGLGDTNYDKFCYMGKSLDKRFTELGAERFLEVHCADEAVGLEDTVDAFRSKVLAALPALMAAAASGAADESAVAVVGLGPGAEADAAAKGSDAAGEGKGVEAVMATNGAKSDGAEGGVLAGMFGKSELQLEAELLEAENFGIPTALPAGIVNFADLARVTDLQQKVATPPADANLPKNKDTAADSARILTDASAEQKSTCLPNKRPQDGWNATHPYVAEVMSARWLTGDAPLIEGRSGEKEVEWGTSRRVVHMELSLGDSGIKYDPGDSIGICVPNPDYLVQIVFERLREHLKSKADFRAASLALECHVLLGDGDMVTLNELIGYRLDLVSIPRKAAVLVLSRYCAVPDEAVAMRWLCSKCEVGKQLWAQFIEGQGLGIGELLILFPSCCPPLSALVSCVGAMLPRYYSIASSQLVHTCSATIAFSIEHFTCTPSLIPSTKIRRAGLCTSYLEKVLSPWLYAARAAAAGRSAPTVRIFKRPSVLFQLPGNCGYPLILIGPGTGVAPFIGFLEHRSYSTDPAMKKSPSAEVCAGQWRSLDLDETDLPSERNNVEEFIHSVPPGPVHLFYGCRGEQDWIYRDYIQECLRKKTLTTFEIAMSRVSSEKHYVTHKIKDRAAEIARLILDSEAIVYICGDGNSMAKDVYAAIKQCLIDNGSEKVATDALAEAYLHELKVRRRYILEIWS